MEDACESYSFCAVQTTRGERRDNLFTKKLTVAKACCS